MWRVVPIAIVWLAASAAVASPKDDSAAAVARGVALRKAGDDAGALKEFQRARALQPSAVATAQIGLARQALGEWVEAEAELQEALRERDDPWIAKNRATLEGALAMVRTHLGGVEVVGLPAGAEVFIDGRRVGVAPLTGPVRATIGYGTDFLMARSDLKFQGSYALAGRAFTNEVYSVGVKTPVCNSHPTDLTGKKIRMRVLFDASTSPPQTPSPYLCVEWYDHADQSKGEGCDLGAAGWTLVESPILDSPNDVTAIGLHVLLTAGGENGWTGRMYIDDVEIVPQ